jgi:pimeloyl-ACP methyl ester carboxylesterase
MYAITGITGKVGGELARNLLAAGQRVPKSGRRLVAKWRSLAAKRRNIKRPAPLCAAHAMQPDIPTRTDGRDIMMMNRRLFSAALVTGAAASLMSARGIAANSTPAKANNVVLLHGLFADGSCWSEVIARLQAAGLNATAVQNPLTTLPEAVASAQRVLARQDGPTVLVGHSFSGMIVTEAGVHPNVSALVYVAARAPDAGEDYTALAKTSDAASVRWGCLRRR